MWNFTFKNYHFGPPHNFFLIFKENPPKKFSSCFDFDSALKTINAQIILVIFFENLL